MVQSGSPLVLSADSNDFRGATLLRHSNAKVTRQGSSTLLRPAEASAVVLGLPLIKGYCEKQGNGL